MRTFFSRRIVMVIGLAGGLVPAFASAECLVLDGRWSVEEGVAADEIPGRFSHTVAVPGLTNQAQPAFADVDQYETHEYVFTMKRYGILPATEKCDGLGRTRQKRNYFWYARDFQAPARKAACHAGRQQGPVRHGRLAQRPEAGRARGLLHRRPVRRHRRHALGRREPARGPHRRPSRRDARLGLLGHRRRKGPLDAGHLRSRRCCWPTTR